MRKRLRAGRPSPAMVVAIIALVAALAGTGYAATKINGGRLLGGTVKVGKLTDGARNKTVGAGKLTYVAGDTKDVGAVGAEDVNAACPTSKHAVGGGVRVGDTALQVVVQSHPFDSPDEAGVVDDGWKATVNGAGTAQAFVICAPSGKFEQITEG